MSDTHKAIEAVWKIESTRLIAGIARVTRDIGIAEELAQDALVAALERWPDEGIPEKPAAWLMTAAKRRAIDALRRGRMLELKHGEMKGRPRPPPYSRFERGLIEKAHSKEENNV
jgi:RNA polymerase sigma-70 factor, ECF subfamily